MAAKQPPVGIDHVTVVPTEPVPTPETDADDESDDA